MKQFTDITVLLDRSGSMASIKSAMETAFDEFVNGHKSNPTTKLTLIQFDTSSPQDVVYQCVPVTAVEPLKLHPRGGTPLLDALCTAIDNTGARLAAMPLDSRPDQVMILVITDGEENASRQRTRQDVFNRVTKQQNDYKWQFVYLGANQDAIKEANSYGIGAEWAINYAASAAGVANSTQALLSNTVSYTNQTKRGQSMTKFSDEQRAAAETK